MPLPARLTNNPSLPGAVSVLVLKVSCSRKLLSTRTLVTPSLLCALCSSNASCLEMSLLNQVFPETRISIVRCWGCTMVPTSGSQSQLRNRTTYRATGGSYSQRGVQRPGRRAPPSVEPHILRSTVVMVRGPHLDCPSWTLDHSCYWPHLPSGQPQEHSPFHEPLWLSVPVTWPSSFLSLGLSFPACLTQ